MIDKDKLQQTVSKNLTFYRKAAGFTQQQLAEKLNYSDKAVSKWERGDGAPDLFVLSELAAIYGVTVNDFLSVGKKRLPVNLKVKSLIGLMSAGAVGLVATIVFVVLRLLNIDAAWLAYIYAIPCVAIVLTVLNAIWRQSVLVCVAVSVLVWGTLLSIFLSFRLVNIGIIFMIGVPLQLLTVLAALVKLYRKPKAE